MPDALITVCASCRCASCWYGVFLCDEAQVADVVGVPRSVLLREAREHPSYLSDETHAHHTGTLPEAV